MRTVELVNGIKSSVLGFGCAPILGSVDGKKADRAIRIALENGINHFDLARSYGYGEAEKFVGNVLKGKRQQVVLASKFGIRVSWKATILRPVKPILRYAMQSFKKAAPSNQNAVKGSAATAANRLHYRIPLNEKEMRKSLEESLKALRTDYLDYFFIHEPQIEVSLADELNATASKLKDEGKIKAWGLAFMREKEALHTAYLNKFDVLQFDNSPGATGYNKSAESRGQKPNIIFSPLSGGSKTMAPADKLKRLFSDFPQSVVLCSMFSEGHIRNNVAAVADR